MSMRFDCAIAHYEKILQTAIHINSGFLEPLPNEMARSQWSCHRPAVHINHGKHFTSHYAIYGTPNDRSHPYWGNAEQYFS
jgi:hypothetical protein